MTTTKKRLGALFLAFMLAISSATTTFAYAGDPSTSNDTEIISQGLSAYGASFELKVPSAQGVAPGRDFYVIGTIKNANSIPADTRLTVSLCSDDKQHIFSTVSTSGKAKDSYMWLKYPGLKNVSKLFNGYGMPDLMSSAPNASSFDATNMPDGFKDPTLKCYYNDTMFSALILGTPTGSSEEFDEYEIDRSNVEPTTAGDYRIVIKLGEEVVVDYPFKIEAASDIILARFSPDKHVEQVKDYATRNKIRILLDPFPGFWSSSVLKDAGINYPEEPNFFAEIQPRWRQADSQEYTVASPHVFLYNISELCASNRVEINKVIYDQRVNNFKIRYYDMGEPFLPKSPATTCRSLDMNTNHRVAFSRIDYPYSPGETIQEGKVYLDDLDGVKIVSYSVARASGTPIIISLRKPFGVYGVLSPIPNEIVTEVTYNDNTKEYVATKRINKVVYEIWKFDSSPRQMGTYNRDLDPLKRYYSGRDEFSEGLYEFGNALTLPQDCVTGQTYTIIAKFYSETSWDDIGQKTPIDTLEFRVLPLY